MGSMCVYLGGFFNQRIYFAIYADSSYLIELISVASPKPVICCKVGTLWPHR